MQGNLLVPFLEGLEAATPPGYSAVTGDPAKGNRSLPYHITPTALGGKDTLANKWVYHRHCHDEKTAEDLEKIRKASTAGVNTTRP